MRFNMGFTILVHTYVSHISHISMSFTSRKFPWLRRNRQAALGVVIVAAADLHSHQALARQICLVDFALNSWGVAGRFWDKTIGKPWENGG